MPVPVTSLTKAIVDDVPVAVNVIECRVQPIAAPLRPVVSKVKLLVDAVHRDGERLDDRGTAGVAREVKCHDISRAGHGVEGLCDAAHGEAAHEVERGRALRRDPVVGDPVDGADAHRPAGDLRAAGGNVEDERRRRADIEASV